MNNPAHFNNFPGVYFLIFDPSTDLYFDPFLLSLIHISDLVAAIQNSQNSQKKNQDPFNPAKEILF